MSFVRAGLTASQGGSVKCCVMFWFTRVIAVSFCAAGAFASDGGQAEAQPAPLLQRFELGIERARPATRSARPHDRGDP